MKEIIDITNDITAYVGKSIKEVVSKRDYSSTLAQNVQQNRVTQNEHIGLN